MKKLFWFLNVLTLALLFTHCANDDNLDIDPDTGNDDPIIIDGGNNNGNGGNTVDALDDRALPLTVAAPNDNPTTNAKIELGRLLFYDPILSGGEDVACATCHHPQFGYADGRELSIGVGGVGLGPNRVDAVNNDGIGLIQRNAPTVINTGFNGMQENGSYIPDAAPMFWDNRTLSLEAQALGPILSFEEMRGHAYEEDVALDVVVGRLNSIPEYRNRFQNVFGGGANAINSDNIGRALATFQRSIVANDSPFDRYARGDENAMTQQQIDGMQRFDQVGCADCHSGPMFSDYELHVLAVPDNQDLGFSDTGANGTYAFRTPTLRNLDETGPYFHNGVAGNLNQVLNFYRRIQGGPGGGGPGGGGGGLNPNPNVPNNQIAQDARQLNLRQNDINDIIAFLDALNDDDFDRIIPNSVPSGLQVGGNID